MDSYPFIVDQRVYFQNGKTSDKKLAIIKWIGKLPPLNGQDLGLLAGLECDDAVGKGNGIYKKIRYFTAKDDHAAFVPLANLKDAQENINLNASSSQNLNIAAAPRITPAAYSSGAPPNSKGPSPQPPNLNGAATTRIGEASFLSGASSNSNGATPQPNNEFNHNGYENSDLGAIGAPVPHPQLQYQQRMPPHYQQHALYQYAADPQPPNYQQPQFKQLQQHQQQANHEAVKEERVEEDIDSSEEIFYSDDDMDEKLKVDWVEMERRLNALLAIKRAEMAESVNKRVTEVVVVDAASAAEAEAEAVAEEEEARSTNSASPAAAVELDAAGLPVKESSDQWSKVAEKLKKAPTQVQEKLASEKAPLIVSKKKEKAPVFVEELAKNNPKYKKTLCHFWKTTGKCSHGDRCLYAHGEKEIRVDVKPKIPFKKTVLCTYHMNGGCRNGDTCSFAHGEHELNTARKM